MSAIEEKENHAKIHDILHNIQQNLQDCNNCEVALQKLLIFHYKDESETIQTMLKILNKQFAEKKTTDLEISISHKILITDDEKKKHKDKYPNEKIMNHRQLIKMLKHKMTAMQHDNASSLYVLFVISNHFLKAATLTKAHKYEQAWNPELDPMPTSNIKDPHCRCLMFFFSKDAPDVMFAQCFDPNYRALGGGKGILYFDFYLNMYIFYLFFFFFLVLFY